MIRIRLSAAILLLWVASTAVSMAQAQAVVRFANLGVGVDAPFFGAQGTNRLAGSNYVAALWVASGTSPTFTQVSPPQRFQEGINAGYWVPINVVIPLVAPGTVLRVQVRFWDQTGNPARDFAAAEEAGAEVGVTAIQALILNPDNTPTPLFGLQSASTIPTLTLSRGAPEVAFNSGATANGSQLLQLCNIPVGTNRWFRLTSSVAAQAVLNSDGSSIDTVMAAFSGSVVDVNALVPLACNDDRAPAVTSSAFILPVEANRLYLICIAGKNGANGPVRLNYTAGVALQIRPGFGGVSLEVSWPADSGDYHLESSSHPLQPGSWQIVDEPPLLIDSRYVLPLVPGLRPTCFRLRAVP